MTPDANALVAVPLESTINIWLTTLAGDDVFSERTAINLPPQRAMRNKSLLELIVTTSAGGIALMPDGEIIYRSRASGRAQMWSMNTDLSVIDRVTGT